MKNCPKKFLSLLLLLSLVASLCLGCGDNTAGNKNTTTETQESQSENINEEEVKAQLDQVYDEISNMDQECQYMANCILTYWDTNGAWTFEGLFDESFGSYAKQEWKDMRDEVFKERADVESLQTSIPDKIKAIEVPDNLKEYKDAISDMFIEVNSFATIVTKYPSGYTKITYSSLVSDYISNFEKAKSNVDLKK